MILKHHLLHLEFNPRKQANQVVERNVADAPSLTTDVRQNENSLVVMPMDKQRGLESSKCPYARPVTAPRRSDVPSVTEAGR
jgi:hypothetical protein